MNAAPRAALIEIHFDALGFKVENKGKKNSTVRLEPKISSPETQLALSYYAVSLSSFMFLEGFIAKIIQNKHLEQKEARISIDELAKSGARCAELMTNENLNIHDFSRERLVEKVKAYQALKVFTFNDD